MASYKDILNENENQNWLKGSLALRITKAGLRGLVEGDSYRVQQRIHSSISQTRNLALGTSCSFCLTENLLQCPTRGLCTNPRNCKYHHSPILMFRPCPSQICDDFRNEIFAVHRYGGPSWKNTKADQWCTNHWQVAKCFMPPDGYQDVSSFDETDFNGIISFMINCTEFDRSLSFNITNQPNILTKSRETGRSIRHSPDLKVTDRDLADYFATLNTLLTDSTYLAGDSNAQEAVIKLNQLEKDALPISSKDVRELLEEAKATIEAGKHELVQSVETGKQEIQDMVSMSKTAVETGKRQVEVTVSKGTTAIVTGIREIKETVSEGKTAVETGKRELEEAVLLGKIAIETGKREIEETASEALQRIRDVSCLSNEEQKEDLRQRLAKYYQKQLNRAPISPLLSDKDERLDKFYVPPKIVEKDHRRVCSADKREGTPVTSYRHVFCKGSQFRKSVFIVGEAGMGKSSCTAINALKWTRQFSSSNTCTDTDNGASHQKSSEYSLLKEMYLLGIFSDLDNILFCEEDQIDIFQDDTFFKEIEFLFHLTLSDSCDLCDLTDIIRDQLIDRIYQQDERAAAYCTMRSVLLKNRCVIVADGLDEWTHPNETNCKCSEEDKVIPSLVSTIDATVLITSRPWRMSQQRVKDTQIDTYLEIEGTADIMLLIENMLNSLNETVTEKKTLLDFIRFVDRMKLTSLLSVPIISMLLVCLWFEGMHESFSLCDIYAYTIDMMFGRKALPVPVVSQKNIPFPRCFRHTKHVQKYYSIVMEMAQLAFTTLFSNDQTSSLVIKKVDCLARENIVFVLKSGILQERKAASLIRKSSSYSFIHKTVQEFLAAVYMSHHPEEFQRVLKPCYEKNRTIMDVSQVFIFICGMNIELANKMSVMISNAPFRFDQGLYVEDIISIVEATIVSGYKEAQSNQIFDIQLSLFSFDGSTTESEILNDLLSINKSKVRYILTGNFSISQAKLQEVFSSSTDTLTNVNIFRQAGEYYDLSACNRLQYLLIFGSEITDVVVNTKNLVSLHLQGVSNSVECNILQSFEHGSDNLKRFVIGGITNVSLFCQILPQLTHLDDLELWSADLGDHALLLPISVTNVTLTFVRMTAQSLRGLVKMVEDSTHDVNCNTHICFVDPYTEYEDIKRDIQTRENIVSFITDGCLSFRRRN